jgi:hypothetical protein
MQGLLSGDRGLPRDRALKVAAALCDMVVDELLASYDW